MHWEPLRFPGVNGAGMANSSNSNGGGFDPGAGGILGINGLQQSIDTFQSAVNDLKSVVNNMGTVLANGMMRQPALGMMSEGQTFTTGSLNSLAANLTPSQTRGAATIGAGAGSGSGASSSTGTPAGTPPTMGQTAAGGGANGGGSTFGGSPGASTPGTPSSGPSSTPPTMGQTAAGGGANGGGGAPGTYGGNGGGTVPNGSGGPSGQFLGQSLIGITAGFGNYAASQYNSQLLFDAYGRQMAGQYGMWGQVAQNAAFGNGNNSVWNAPAGNAQDAAAAGAILNNMTGGGFGGSGVISSANALAAVNAMTLANQGMSASSGAQLASAMYSPTAAMQMLMMTGISPINPRTGGLNSLPSVINGLASEGYIGGGGYNAATGVFNSKNLKASFLTGRGTSWMALNSLGYSNGQIQDIQSMLNQANQIAVSGHVKGGWQSVYNMMNQAQGGPGISEAQTQKARATLHSWDPNWKLSTIQKQGTLASLNMAESQSQSSSYNAAVQDATSVMTQFTQAVDWFLQKTGLNKVVGGAAGAIAGLNSTGIGGVLSSVLGFLPGGSTIANFAGIGGGAGSVSSSSGSMIQGSNPGSTVSTVSVGSQVRTAVTDAEAQVGVPYVWGGDSPKVGFDCSGLVMWAYDEAGVQLPRTSEQQWAYLQDKSVPTDQVQEGDVLFQAGANGTYASPGHEAMYVGGGQIVEAPAPGLDVRIRGYNSNEWQHAGRPVGPGGSMMPASGTQTGSSASGAGSSGVGNYGSTEEVDAIAAALAGSGTPSFNGTSASTNSNMMSTSTSGNMYTASEAQNRLLGQSLAKKMYGWTGQQWTALDQLWGTYESGWNNLAQNPSSTAYGIAQFLNSTWASYGPKTSDPTLQITYGLEYIYNRYKNPVNALNFELSHTPHWYGSGTRGAARGLALVGDRGPELINFSGGEQIHSAKETANMLRGSASLPAQVPWSASPAAQYILDKLTPANDYACAGGVSVSITVDKGAFVISGSGASVASDVQTMADAFSEAVERHLEKSKLLQGIAAGAS